MTHAQPGPLAAEARTQGHHVRDVAVRLRAATRSRTDEMLPGSTRPRPARLAAAGDRASACSPIVVGVELGSILAPDCCRSHPRSPARILHTPRALADETTRSGTRSPARRRRHDARRSDQAAVRDSRAPPLPRDVAGPASARGNGRLGGWGCCPPLAGRSPVGSFSAVPANSTAAGRGRSSTRAGVSMPPRAAIFASVPPGCMWTAALPAPGSSTRDASGRRGAVPTCRRRASRPLLRGIRIVLPRPPARHPAAVRRRERAAS